MCFFRHKKVESRICFVLGFDIFFCMFICCGCFFVM